MTEYCDSKMPNQPYWRCKLELGHDGWHRNGDDQESYSWSGRERRDG